MASHKIIIDCDPGVDDAVAITLALAAPDEIELLGVTTVAGNVPLENTTRNAIGLLALLRRPDIPVYAGCARPLMRAVGHRSIMHGTEGLGGVELTNDGIEPASEHAVDFIIDTVMSRPGEVTLCPIGPLTNVAVALVKEPRLASNLKQIVFMGGAAFGSGNTTPSAEFNVYVDPHAAHIVACSGVQLTMFGLDVTRSVIATPERLVRLETFDNDVARTVVRMMTAYAQGDPCLHDPCVIAWMIDPGLFSGVDALLEVDCAAGPNYGRTVASVSSRHLAGRQANCKIITNARCDDLFEMLEQRLARFNIPGI
ncbi:MULTISPECIES: nucleoside hydrolase [Rhizobium]|uniref:nucleoside hydrolase n=1 Tax=Rhizobium TaxID=379 RepID=UPI00195DB293|nr:MULTISPECIES: nucleoside hydrolase [Rhizobium]MBM7043808.1 nucleoside hydrolase [Rhizobium lusitanum]